MSNSTEEDFEQRVKRRKVDEKEEAKDEDNSMVADFAGSRITPGDLNGINALMRQLFRTADIDLLELTKLITAHPEIGIVLTDDDPCDDRNEKEGGSVYGVTTVMDLSRKIDGENYEPPIESLRKYICGIAEREMSLLNCSGFTKIFNNDANRIAFFINERFANFPCSICVPLLQQLRREILDISGKPFTHFIVICKLYKEVTGAGSSTNNVTWVNEEDVQFAKKALYQFEVCLFSGNDQDNTGNWDEDMGNLIPYRRFLLLTAENMLATIDELSSIINTQSILSVEFVKHRSHSQVKS